MASLNRYENMEFPEYKYRPYPRWVTPANGIAVMVNDSREEKELLGATKEEATEKSAELNATRKMEAQTLAAGGDRDSLLEQAGELGIVADRRWGADKLKEAIAKAESAKS